MVGLYTKAVRKGEMHSMAWRFVLLCKLATAWGGGVWVVYVCICICM